MNKITSLIGTLSIGLLMFTSCSDMGISDSENGEEVTNFLSNKQALIDAKEALINFPKYKDKKIMVFQGFSINDNGSFDIDIQDPDNADNIDNYEFDNGKWGTPTPVQISGGGNMSANLTPLDDIRFELIPGMVEIYTEKTKDIEGAKDRPSSMFFHLFVPNQSRYWSPGTIQGTRVEYKLDFKLNGEIEEFEKR